MMYYVGLKFLLRMLKYDVRTELKQFLHLVKKSKKLLNTYQSRKSVLGLETVIWLHLTITWIVDHCQAPFTNEILDPGIYFDVY